MALSSNSKKGLALGALLPVLLSVWTESRKQSETQTQRAAAHIEERQKQREAAQARDLDGAQKFLAQVTSDGADPDDTHRDGSFCDHVYIASELVRLTSQATATQAAVIGALTYRSERPTPDGKVASEANLPPRICDCPIALQRMQTNWAPSRNGTVATAAVAHEMVTTLETAVSACATQVASRAESAVTTSTPTTAPAPRPKDSAAPLQKDCIPPPADAATVRVYIQIAREDQRDRAKDLQKKLRCLRYVVPGIERVGSEASPAHMQLRYVFAEDRVEAEKLRADMTTAIAATDTEVVPPLTRYRRSSLRRSFEIWFPKQNTSVTP